MSSLYKRLARVSLLLIFTAYCYDYTRLVKNVVFFRHLVVVLHPTA
jgi:hypothetical protein